MRDTYFEETSKVLDEKKAIKKYNTFRFISLGALSLFIIWAIIFISFCDFSKFDASIPILLIIDILLWILPFIVTIILFIVFKKISNKSYVEYDYSFLSGSIRVAKVPKNGYRRGVIKFDAVQIERIGKVDSVVYNNLSHMPGVKKYNLTCNTSSSNDVTLYYMFVRHEGMKKLLIFDCSKIFIATVLRFCNRNVLEKN